jgi:hypothetical protein
MALPSSNLPPPAERAAEIIDKLPSYPSLPHLPLHGQALAAHIQAPGSHHGSLLAPSDGMSIITRSALDTPLSAISTSIPSHLSKTPGMSISLCNEGEAAQTSTRTFPCTHSGPLLLISDGLMCMEQQDAEELLCLYLDALDGHLTSHPAQHLCIDARRGCTCEWAASVTLLNIGLCGELSPVDLTKLPETEPARLGYKLCARC